MRAKLSIGADGEVVLPRQEAEGLGAAPGDPVDVVSARSAFALLTPARAETPRAWFAGSLAALTVPEVIQFVFTSLKTGVLLLSFGGEDERARHGCGTRMSRSPSTRSTSATSGAVSG